MAGGGVSSNYDPLDVAQYTEAEFKAAVSAGENWGTYVTVHAYTPKAIKTAIDAGVKCIDHGQLADEATAKLIAEKGMLGEISEVAYADLILVDGNPLINIKLVEDPENNFKIIIKDGVIYKNTLDK